MTLTTPDQVVYSGVLEAMGYASNRETFRRLADVLPFDWLQTMPADDWENALFSASGLHLPSIDVPGHIQPESWRLSRLRPANHPTGRIAGVALLLRRFGPHLAQSMSERILDCKHRRDLRALFTVRRGGETFIGPGRADELVTSGAFPLILALTGRDDAVEKLYASYYSPPSTRWTRALSAVLQRDDGRFIPRTALEHQGFHHVYTRHCRYDRQSACPLCGDLDG